jgi:hypothetical protein
MFIKNIFNLNNLVLVTALSLSAIAAWYSILGLVAIFAAAAIPIIIMGGSLEIAKVVTTVWLHKHWNRTSWQLKLYLVPAVIALAFLTSMGIFGFLSKAHMDQSIVSGDAQSKLALFDEKIKTQRDNIEIARKALQQMDAQVEARLNRGDSEAGAERAVQIRRQQARERQQLQTEIAKSQQEIAKLNELRAPIAAENRKIEAEVGPIKYIAALIYGDNPDNNLLERAVRWVIILIVLVFDPLALTLVIAANTSRRWDNEVEDKEEDKEEVVDENIPIIIKEEEQQTNSTVEVADENKNLPNKENNITEQIIESNLPFEPVYLKKGFKPVPGYKIGPVVYFPETEPVMEHVIENFVNEILENNTNVETETNQDNNLTEETTPIENQNSIENIKTNTDDEIVTEGVTKLNPVTDLGNGYVIYDDKSFNKDALKELQPSLFALRADSLNPINTNFGTEFPKISNKGDVFVRVDILPNKVFKFDGKRWIEINKNLSDSYLTDVDYIQYLINKIHAGEYDIELLTDIEKQQIQDYLNNQKL